MATAGLSSEALKLLQSFTIDLKDFSKARSRYEKVLMELSTKTDTKDGEGAEGVAEASGTRQMLHEAWGEYLALSQGYFRKLSSAVVEDLMSKTREKASAAERAEKLNELCAIAEKWYVRNEKYFEFPEAERLVVLVIEALDSSSRVMRFLGLQLTRICLANVTFASHFFAGDGPGLIGVCLDRENTELEYALNVCMQLIELKESDPMAYPDFPFGWVYRIVAILDLQDPVPNLHSKRRRQAARVAVSLLRQFPAMATAGSLHTLLLRYCIQNGAATLEEIQSILQVLLDVFDRAETRQYLRNNDLDVLYAPFLYTREGSTPEIIDLMNGAKDVLAMVMRTWVGVLWTCSETKGLRAVINILHLPGDLDRKMVLLAFFKKVLCQLAPHRGVMEMETWYGVEGNKRRKEKSDVTSVLDETSGFDAGRGSIHTFGEGNMSMNSLDVILGDLGDGREEFVPTTKAIGYHVLDPILGRVLLMFSHHGLPLALVSIIQNNASSRILTTAASSLLQNLLTLMDTLLPERSVKRIHTALNRAVGRLVQEGDWSFGGGLTLRVLQHCKTRKDVRVSAAIAGANFVGCGRVSVPSDAMITTCGLGTVELDDAAFKSMVHDTNVEQAISFLGWNFDLLLLLVQGPLRNAQRFRWVLSETYFFHRLIAFYQPSPHTHARTFISLQPKDCSPKVCLFGIALLDLFHSTREGAQALDRFGFTEVLASCLEDVVSGTPRVLTRQLVDTRIGHTLLHMIGCYSFSANGLMAMKEHNMFGIISTMLAKLSGERVTSPSLCDTLQCVCRQLLQHLYIGAVPNYGVCEEIRQIFRAALCNDADSIRLCAAMQLRKELWRDLSTSMRWGIETLVQALHDDCISVVESAFKLLLNICLCSDEALDYLISLSPTVLMESDVIQDNAKHLNLDTLLYCIVGRPSGFRFLQCYGWVEQELRQWEESQSAFHVLLVERMQSGEHVDMLADCREEITGQLRQRNAHSISDPLFAFYRTTTFSASISTSNPPTVSTSTSSTASSGFFPSHFAAVLCKSNEGCTMFKHSNLWQRSVKRIMEQPLPPDVLYDDGTYGSTEGTDDDADDDACYSEKALNEEDPSFWVHLGSKAEINAATKCGDARALRLSREGRLPCSHSAELISASRGYKSAGQEYILESVGDVGELKDAIMCVCHAASSDTGFALMRSVPGLQKRLMALSRFGATATLRSICLVGECLLARSKRCAEQLSEMSYYVHSESNAYTSADGVPYSVAFACVRPSKWTSIGRRKNKCKVSSAQFSYMERNDDTRRNGSMQRDEQFGSLFPKNQKNGFEISSRRIWDQVCTLSNPVSREGAKKKLYLGMKQQPHLFVDPTIRRLLMNAAQTFRMRHAERKFIADLLETAPLAKPTPRNRHATVVEPSASTELRE